MITATNYLTEIERIGIDNLSEWFRENHKFVMLTTENGSDWELYHKNEVIRKQIDHYLTRLNQHQQKKEIQPEPDKKLTEPKQIKSVKGKQGKSNQEKTIRKSANDSSPGDDPEKKVKRVEHIREEIKFIKRFVGLHNKTKSPNAILAFIKALQRSIVQKLIRKTSPLAKEIEMIQDKLVNAYNKMEGDESFQINERDLARLVALAGGEEVYPSVKFIRRFIGMQERELKASQIESFLKQLENAVEKKKITRDDPYADKLNAIHKKLRSTSGKITLTKAELNGLEGIVKACACKPNLGKIYHARRDKLRSCKKGTYSDSKEKGTCSHNRGLSGVLSAEQMANRKFEMLHFIDPWKSLLGMPAKNFTMMLHGEPNAGKTTLLLKFAKYLADNFGKVMYISSEEYAASTMTTKINELLNPIPANLFFSPNLKEPDLSQYDFIILDSVNDLGLKLQDFKTLRKDHPNTSFILILQHTKDGQYRGGKDWEHEVEVAGEVENGVLTIYRNRYGVKGSMDFFNRSNGVTTPRPYPLNNIIM